MTSLERVLCALRGEPADRRVFTLALSLYGARLSGCPIRSYYSDPMRYLEGQREVVRFIDPDIVFAPFALPFEALAYGGEGVWLDKFPPNVRKPPFREQDPVQPLGDDLLLQQGVAYLVESTRLLAEDAFSCYTWNMNLVFELSMRLGKNYVFLYRFFCCSGCVRF